MVVFVIKLVCRLKSKSSKTPTRNSPTGIIGIASLYSFFKQCKEVSKPCFNEDLAISTIDTITTKQGAADVLYKIKSDALKDPFIKMITDSVINIAIKIKLLYGFTKIIVIYYDWILFSALQKLNSDTCLND